ncbi:single-stranded DNA-binding protein [Streptomyces sp. CB02959]|uniref:single-stranded DNA-binding protein n=1 Tax=Streptomyces sp. CB02959 TaxID=2020330 RepID=UPI000C279630|nr:single-stranded DNA-binding protein [Streptomyces sp. CB02959]PJN40492.1 single-stranded DNA-binding protein [Streptomyces sp. CB02959]
MSGETTITMTGNVVADPELRFTPSGAAVCNFRMANTPRKFNRQTNEWEDGEPLFLAVAVWRQQAEHVAESITRGMRVIVTGRLTQRQYEDREGKTRSSYEIQADEVAPSLLRATATVTKANGNNGGAQQPQERPYSQPQADQWSTQFSDQPPPF